MKIRKLLLALACVGILCMSCAIAVCAEETEVTTVDCGTCGENLKWELDSEGTLTISGTGAMEDYDDCENFSPWFGKGVEIKNVVVSAGETSIGESAFTGDSSLTSVTIPDRVTNIGNYAFSYCQNISSIVFMGSKPAIGENAYIGVTANAYYSDNPYYVSWNPSITTLGTFM